MDSSENTPLLTDVVITTNKEEINHHSKHNFDKYEAIKEDELKVKFTESNGEAIACDEERNLKKIGPLAAFGLCVNCIFGTGVFGLPHAFSYSGYVLTTILLLGGGLFNLISMNYTLEFLSRCEGILKTEEKKRRLSEIPSQSIMNSMANLYQSSDTLIKLPSNTNDDTNYTTNNTNYTANNTNDATNDATNDVVVADSDDNKITFRKIDFSFAAYLLAGNKGRVLTIVAMSCYCFGACWSYASVFSSSMETLVLSYAFNVECGNPAIPLSSELQYKCGLGYYIALAVFSVIVMTLTQLQVAETTWVQGFLAVYRVVALLIMIITVIIKIKVDGLLGLENTKPFKFEHLGSSFGTCLLALNCHYNMPDLLQPLINKEKHARKVSIGSISLSMMGFLVIGLLAGLAFKDINPLCTINWAQYTGCGSGWDSCDQLIPNQYNGFGLFIQIVILIFPCLCVTSSFPIVALTLATNAEQLVPKIIKRRFSPKLIIVMLRFSVCLLPLVLAAAFKKLSVIFSACGLFGFFLSLTVPCWLHFQSIRHFKKYYLSKSSTKKNHQTPYNIKYLSNALVSFVLCVISILFLGYVTFNFIKTQMTETTVE